MSGPAPESGLPGPTDPPTLGTSAARRRRYATLTAWGLWAIFALIVGLMVILDHGNHTVMTVYRGAAHHFLRSEPMYSPGQDGWLYPVQSAIVLIPYAALPDTLSEVAWRLTGIGLLARAVAGLAAMASSLRWKWGSRLFLILTILTIPAATGAARNGQANVHMSALLVLAALAVQRRGWTAAASWLTLSVAAKPTAVPVVLLMGVLYSPLRWRLAIGLILFAASPFLRPNWAYVADQIHAWVVKLGEAGEPRVGTFCDLVGLLSQFGVSVPLRVMTAARVIAALGTLALASLALRRLPSRVGIAVVLGLGTGYLMVFNPRTEGNTYVIMTPALAVLAAWALARDSRSRLGWVMAIACILLGLGHVFIPGGRDHIIRPIIAIVFLAWLGWAVITDRGRRTVTDLCPT